MVVNHQHRGRWWVWSSTISCRQVAVQEVRAVVGEAVALKACGCEPSAQRPVVDIREITISTDLTWLDCWHLEIVLGWLGQC